MLKTQTHKVLMLRRSGTPSNDANRGVKSQVNGGDDCSSRQPCGECGPGGAVDVARQRSREALLMLRRSGTPSNDADRGVRSQADGDNN